MRTRLVVASLLPLLAACSAGSPGDAPAPGPDGSLIAAFGFDGPQHDVAFMGYAVYAGEVDCAEPGDAEPVAGATVPMEEEFLPLWLEADGAAGDMHPFADALFVLQPGDYTVCATPLDDALEPSEHCASTSGTATVMAEMTTEIVLYAQCLGDPTGALDVVVALNDPPHIVDLVIGPSKFVTTCEWATIQVFATDPNGDALAYAWALTGGPDDGDVWADPLGDGSTAFFKTCTPGEYALEVTVTDGHGGAASLSFPIHVSDAGPAYQLFVDGTPLGAVPVLSGAADVVSFYSYGTPAGSSANTGLETADTTLVMLYQEIGGPLSFVLINDLPNDGSGGAMSLSMSGLENATAILPIVQDDPGDVYTPVGAGGLDVDWNWVACCTDGLAVTFEDKFACVDVTLESNTGTGPDWLVVSGDYPDAVSTDVVPVAVGSTLTICHCLADAPMPPEAGAP